MRVGLLSPYCGGNLGDGAIHEALVQGIRARWPQADVFLLSLYPQRITRLHDWRSYPLCVADDPYYGVTVDASTNPQAARPAAAPQGPGIKDALKRVPGLYGLLRLTKASVVGLRDGARRVAREVAHALSGVRLCRSADILIVAGGGQIDDYWGGAWGHPWTLFKWAILARIARIPFVVMSVGTCSLESSLSRLFVYGALRLASFRSYRDEQSRQLLEWARFTRTDPVAPDLAFSFRPPPAVPLPGGGRPRIGVSPIAYLSPHYWPRSDAGVYQRYLQVLEEFVLALLRDGYAVDVFTTASSDRHVVQQLLASVNPKAAAAGLDEHIRAVQTLTLPDLFALLRGVERVVASRLHGVILAHLAAKPVLAISYDRKVDTHMEAAGQTAYCLDIHQLEPDSLRQKFEQLGTHREGIRVQLEDMRFRNETALGGQYESVLALARMHPAQGSASGVKVS